ncbi:S41 family peptidase [Chitinophaga rhizosphaerae]|uniref:S41 family peptidase n=1 Tax=Chitinophaga rhizosphaerae TaxID=1864947 RepID=UPI000F802342|nr:S41 family peptidase [Chitinophaga rhizosphaerae]
MEKRTRKLKPPLPIRCLVILVLLWTGCGRKGDLPAPAERDSLHRYNQWILDSMRRFYLWSDQLPAHPDMQLAPTEFFHALRNASDPFSWIVRQPGLPVPGGTFYHYGFHFALVQHPGWTKGLTGVMLYVSSGSAAERAGFSRGDYFVAVNGAPIRSREVALLQGPAGIVAVTPAKAEGGVLTEMAPRQLAPLPGGSALLSSPVTFLHDGVRTIYLAYRSFQEYGDPSLLETFRKIRNAGAQELILDLRYNDGGSVATCAKLSALLAPALRGSDTYIKFEGNRLTGRFARSLAEILRTSGQMAGGTMESLEAGRLPLRRVFILTTRATVSSAELLINNLKPWTEVIQIGDTTFGKDLAGFIISDGEVPWKIQLIAYRLFNARGEGAYHAGILPTYTVNELQRLPLAPMSAAEDALTGKALSLIYPGRYRSPPDARNASMKAVYSSPHIHAAGASFPIIHQD